MNLKFTPEGIAGLWLAKNIPASGRKEQESLGGVIQIMYDSGVMYGIKQALEAIENCPTVGDAQAKLDALKIELEHAMHQNRKEAEQRENGVDFDPTRP